MTGLHAEITAGFTAAGSEAFTVDATLDVAPGETLVVLGPSGSGKTLLLETVAGFHDHDGVVQFGGAALHERPPEARGFGFVFQDYALFPHLTVRSNVEYGTRYHDETREPDTLLDELGVGHLADRYPPTLSGGEKQRVALARALAIRPAVLLLDEPLAALDVPTRQALRDDLTDVLDEVTAVYVTHNRTTARALGDRIVVMREGTIEQRGTPADVFERPASPMVAEFTGANAIDLAASATLRDLVDGNGTGGDAVTIRPEAVGLDRDVGDVRATVERVVQEDAAHRVTVSFDDVTVDAYTDDPPAVGDDIWVSFPSSRLHRC